MHLVFFTDENDYHLTLIEKPLCDDYRLVCCVTLSSSIVNNFFCNKLCY